MNTARGLSNIFGSTNRSRRHGINANTQPADRQAAINMLPASLGQASARSKRATMPMLFDPEVSTRNWEIYKDPSQESLEPTHNQPQNANVAMTDIASTQPAISRIIFASDNLETASSTSQESSHPQLSIVYAPDEPSRVMAERMIRTHTIVMAEERRRQRRLAIAAAADENVDLTPVTDDELIERLRIKYDELLLLEEDDDGEGVGEEVAEQVLSQQGEGRLELGEAQGQEQSQLQMQDEILGAIHAQPTIYGPDAEVTPLPEPTVLPPSIEVSTSMPVSGPGSGLNFAERARARGLMIGSDEKARKRAKLTEPIFPMDYQILPGGGFIRQYDSFADDMTRERDEEIAGAELATNADDGSDVSDTDTGIDDDLSMAYFDTLSIEAKKRKRGRGSRGKNAARTDSSLE
jgi:hypothetical protein